MSPLETLLADLIAFESITPQDAGCQAYIARYLTQHGFRCQSFDKPPVSNLFARIGTQAPFFLFAGHTDVVPPGDITQWTSPPFELHARNDVLYGRGTADMKGSIAAILSAMTDFLRTWPTFNGSLGILLTSGEEGNDFAHGTPHVMQILAEQNALPDYCLVGEPSSSHTLGDVIKIGRRGSLTAECIFHGKQGHVAYPHLADNPIHQALPALSALACIQWDAGNAAFPPTSLQITQLQAGGDASNIIPATLHMQCNWRYSTEQSAEQIMQRVDALFTQYNSRPIIQWRVNGLPFLTEPGLLVKSCTETIHQLYGFSPELSTSGGTSDARFIAPYGIEVIELGPRNATIHQIDECISQLDLIKLQKLYYCILVDLFSVATAR